MRKDSIQIRNDDMLLLVGPAVSIGVSPELDDDDPLDDGPAVGVPVGPLVIVRSLFN